MSLRVRNLQGACAAIAAIFAAPAAQADVTISTGATTNITCTNGVCTPAHKNAILNVTQLESLLASGSVTVTTASSKASNIVVSAPLSWASANGLILDAYQSITINKAVAVNGTGGLTLTTNDGGAGGALSFGAKGNVTFLSTANSLTINGAAYTLVADTTTLASDIAGSPSGNFALASNYNASDNASFVTTTFNGNFEGLGNTISNLTITSSNQDVGLFAEVSASGTLTDVHLTKVSITGSTSCQNSPLCQLNASLVGLNEGTLSHDSATGLLHMGEGSGGGLVGDNQGTIADCDSSVKIYGSVAHGNAPILGGLVGNNDNAGTIVQSYATGSVQSNRDTAAGGLAGITLETISNSYSTGSVQGGKDARVGGLVGGSAPSNSSGLGIQNSYSTGAVSGGDGTLIGGLVGDDAESGDINNSYWDTTSSGITNSGQGAGNVSNDPGITGLSTSQLQSGLPSGFSSSIWGENSSINGGLPYLLALPPA